MAAGDNETHCELERIRNQQEVEFSKAHEIHGFENGMCRPNLEVNITSNR